MLFLGISVSDRGGIAVCDDRGNTIMEMSMPPKGSQYDYAMNVKNAVDVALGVILIQRQPVLAGIAKHDKRTNMIVIWRKALNDAGIKNMMLGFRNIKKINDDYDATDACQQLIQKRKVLRHLALMSPAK